MGAVIRLRIRQRIAAIAVAALFIGTFFVPPASAAPPPIVPGRLAYPAGGTTAVGVGINAANQNAQLAERIPAQIKPGWKAQPPRCPSAATSEASSISVAGARTVVVDRQYQCTWLSAYNTSTGALLWRHKFHFGQMARTEGSRVYFSHDDPNGGTLLDAYDIATGKLLWSSGHWYGFDKMSVGSGVLVNDHFVIDANTGALKFKLPVSQNHGNTMVAGGKIFSNQSDFVEAFSPTTGQRLWSYKKPARTAGSGNSTPALHNGRLYLSSQYGVGTLVLDPATGKYIRTLPRSEMDIAFDGPIGIFTRRDHNEPDVISAVRLDTGEVYWSRKLGMLDVHPFRMYSSGPVIENGLVWILAAPHDGVGGHLIALDEVTGAVRSTTIQTCAAPLGHIAIAQRRIFTSSNCGVLTYVSRELLPDPGFELGTGGWKAYSTGSLTPVTSPKHEGAKALRVTATSSSPGKTGLAHHSVITNSRQGKPYSASCWVYSTGTNLNLTIRLLEQPQDYSTRIQLASKTITSLPAKSWTKISITGTAARSGERVIPQIYSTNQTTLTGHIVYDNCSVTGG